MAICLEQGADMHMAQLMPLPLTVSCFSKIQIGFTFLVPADPDSPGQRAIKWVCVCIVALEYVVQISVRFSYSNVIVVCLHGHFTEYFLCGHRQS